MISLFNKFLSSSIGDISNSSSCLGTIAILLTLFSFWLSFCICFVILFPLLEGEYDNNLSFFLFKLSNPILFLIPLFFKDIFLLPEVVPLPGCSLSKYLLFSSLCILE